MNTTVVKPWKLYTDGSFDGRSGAGGWAYLLHHPDGNTSQAYGSSTAKTSIDRMEMCAVLGGLLRVPSRQIVLVYSDDESLVSIFNNPRLGKSSRTLRMRIFNELKRIGQYKFTYIPRNSTPQMALVDSLSRAGRFMFKEAK